MALVRIIIISALVVLAGCASTHNANISPDIPQNYAGPDAGYLVVSLGADPDTSYTSYTLFFRPMFKNMAGKIHYRQESGLFFFPKSDRDFDDQKGNGIVYVHKLPAGEYEIVAFNIWLNRGTTQINFNPKDGFSIPFVVEPNTAIYLGEFLAVGLKKKNLIGLNIPAGAKFVIADKQHRDIPIAQQKHPEIQNIKIAIPESKLENIQLVEQHLLL